MEILDKINEISQQCEIRKIEKKVLVMHPSAMILVKDKITRYSDVYNTMESYLFDGKISVFLSFRLPKNHFAFMTKLEYEQNYKPK